MTRVYLESTLASRSSIFGSIMRLDASLTVCGEQTCCSGYRAGVGLAEPADRGGDLGRGGVQVVVDDRLVELWLGGQLGRGGGQAQPDLLVGLGGPGAQPPLQLGHARRADEDEVGDVGALGDLGADLRGAVDVDLEDDV